MSAGAASRGDALDSLGARPVTPVRIIGLTPGAAMLLVGAVVLAFVLRNAFVAAHQTVGWVVACSIVALLVDPIVNVFRAARLAKGWTYRQLSEASGVSHGYICEMEQGTHSPALRHLRRLARALDLDLRATLRGESDG